MTCPRSNVDYMGPIAINAAYSCDFFSMIWCVYIMYTCVYVCMHVCMYACTSMHIYAYVYAWMDSYPVCKNRAATPIVHRLMGNFVQCLSIIISSPKLLTRNHSYLVWKALRVPLVYRLLT